MLLLSSTVQLHAERSSESIPWDAPTPGSRIHGCGEVALGSGRECTRAPPPNIHPYTCKQPRGTAEGSSPTPVTVRPPPPRPVHQRREQAQGLGWGPADRHHEASWRGAPLDPAEAREGLRGSRTGTHTHSMMSSKPRRPRRGLGAPNHLELLVLISLGPQMSPGLVATGQRWAFPPSLGVGASVRHRPGRED